MKLPVDLGSIGAQPTVKGFGPVKFTFRYDDEGLYVKVTFGVLGSLTFYESQVEPVANVKFLIKRVDVPYNKIPFLVLEAAFLGYKVAGYVVDTTTYATAVRVRGIPTQT
jgi:hypothetical protein